MGARQKLNEIHVTGCLLVAALVGVAAGSWAVFLATLFVLIVMGCLGGAIRTAGRCR